MNPIEDAHAALDRFARGDWSDLLTPMAGALHELITDFEALRRMDDELRKVTNAHIAELEMEVAVLEAKNMDVLRHNMALTADEPRMTPDGLIPSTEAVRNAYIRSMRDGFVASEGEAGHEFDRWLALVASGGSE
jgi:hypothetical protein